MHRPAISSKSTQKKLTAAPPPELSPTTILMASTIDNLLCLRAFYKGTSLQAPVINSKLIAFHHMVVKNADTMITSFLRNGYMLSKVKEILKGQMDLMEDGLCRTSDATTAWKEIDQDAWMAKATAGTEMEENGKMNVMLWFVNIAALLKLKVIQNDENNGWLFNHKLSPCPRCETDKPSVEFKTDLNDGNGDVMVCEDCYNEIAEQEEDE